MPVIGRVMQQQAGHARPCLQGAELRDHRGWAAMQQRGFRQHAVIQRLPFLGY